MSAKKEAKTELKTIHFGMMNGIGLYLKVIYPTNDDDRVKVDVLGFYPAPAKTEVVYEDGVYKTKGHYDPVVGDKNKEYLRELIARRLWKDFRSGPYRDRIQEEDIEFKEGAEIIDDEAEYLLS